MSFAPSMTQKRCFVSCRPDVVKSGGCSCHNLVNLSNKSDIVFRISNRIYKLKYILDNGKERNKI